MAASQRQSSTNQVDFVNALLKATNSTDELYSDHQRLLQAISSPASEEGSILRTIAHIGGKYGNIFWSCSNPHRPEQGLYGMLAKIDSRFIPYDFMQEGELTGIAIQQNSISDIVPLASIEQGEIPKVTVKRFENNGTRFVQPIVTVSPEVFAAINTMDATEQNRLSEELSNITKTICGDGSSQKAKQKRLISVISLFSRLYRSNEAALGFVGAALCVCFISGVVPYILKHNKSQVASS